MDNIVKGSSILLKTKRAFETSKESMLYVKEKSLSSLTSYHFSSGNLVDNGIALIPNMGEYEISHT